MKCRVLDSGVVIAVLVCKNKHTGRKKKGKEKRPKPGRHQIKPSQFRVPPATHVVDVSSLVSRARRPSPSLL